jgi:mono/diheme cytochrome c family protein
MNKTILVATGLIAIVVACKKKVGDTTLPAASTGTKTTYVDVKPIIDASCVSCHGANSKDGAYYDYTTVKLSVSKVISEIARGDMPRNAGNLSSAQLNVIKQWDADGLLEK